MMSRAQLQLTTHTPTQSTIVYLGAQSQHAAKKHTPCASPVVSAFQSLRITTHRATPSYTARATSTTPNTRTTSPSARTTRLIQLKYRHKGPKPTPPPMPKLAPPPIAEPDHVDYSKWDQLESACIASGKLLNRYLYKARTKSWRRSALYEELAAPHPLRSSPAQKGASSESSLSSTNTASHSKPTAQPWPSLRKGGNLCNSYKS